MCFVGGWGGGGGEGGYFSGLLNRIMRTISSQWRLDQSTHDHDQPIFLLSSVKVITCQFIPVTAHVDSLLMGVLGIYQWISHHIQ